MPYSRAVDQGPVPGRAGLPKRSPGLTAGAGPSLGLGLLPVQAISSTTEASAPFAIASH